MSEEYSGKLRHLVVVLGDQLDLQSTAFEGFDPEFDAVWMAEVAEEASHVWSHKSRIALFLAAMRHFREKIRERGWTILYTELDDPRNLGNFSSEIRKVVEEQRPRKIVLTEPGEFRIKQVFEKAAADLQTGLEMRPDHHFLCSHDEFASHAKERKQLRMEYFYREMRRKTGVLVTKGNPTGGKWNYDSENRRSFGLDGPEIIPLPLSFPPDAITRKVIRLIARHFPSHPGSLDRFDWPVTRENAEQALEDFSTHRLASFGKYQDAIWTEEPFLYHSLLSAALNLKLLHPREAIDSAIDALHTGRAPLSSVEGFVRQILGWREFVRGVYWRFMPEYADRNMLEAVLPLPGFYWNADTEMNCLRDVLRQTLEYGYAHHIQRLMVTGLFCLLLGVHPRAVHEWYLAAYVDAVEWVELPNTIGMSQFADGGVMASKPYVASGKYIQRMSNYCVDCRYDPAKACGEDACPLTTLYWDFLERHKDVLGRNHRMRMQLRNLDRKPVGETRHIRRQASTIRSKLS